MSNHSEDQAEWSKGRRNWKRWIAVAAALMVLFFVLFFAWTYFAYGLTPRDDVALFLLALGLPPG